MTETVPYESGARASFKEPGMTKMARIPEGWLLMGSETGQDNERPVHCVWIDTFELAACQVTNAEYGIFLAATQNHPPLHWNEPDFSHPEQAVVGVSWFDAVAYCEWLSRVTSRHSRLPSEAEWERAARGGAEQKLYPWGDQPPESLQDYALRWETGPEIVGHAEINTYGIYDIGANVHEWCSDWFDAEYYAASPGRNPQGPSNGVRRASRGGSWRHYTKVSRCAARASIPPEFRYADYGFRVACAIA